MKLLDLKNISYQYPQSEKKAIDSISFSVEEGEYISILGLNGSGKSTLARLLAGFFDPSEGTYEQKENILPGIVFQQPKEQIIAGVVERDTAFGPQNLDMSNAEIELRTIECLSVVSIADKALSRTFELSLGQTQRVAFAGILALFPDLLILDEVTAMLDPDARKNLIELVGQWNSKGHTVIHITHDEDEALSAKRVIVLDGGKISFDGSPSQFKGNKEIYESVFGKNQDFQPAKNSINSETTISAKNISFSYGSFEVFKNISFELKKGQLAALKGPSGCGKSTLFECLSGLKKLSGGKITSVSKPSLCLQESDAAIFAPYAADDVSLGPINNGLEGKKLRECVKSSMNKAHLPFDEYADRNSFSLSGGEKRRLAIAGIIALDKDIMIFDEPTSALDPIARKHVLMTLRQLADEGKTVLFSTHRNEETDIADVVLDWEEISSEPSSDVSDDESSLPELKFEENAKILSSLGRTAQSFMAPPSIPDSLIKKLPAVVKFLLFIVLFSLSTLVYPIWGLGLVLGLSVAYALMSKYPMKKPLAGFRKILPWVLFFLLLEFLFFNIPFKLKIILAAKAVIRIGCCVTTIGTFIWTTNEREIMDGLLALLKPLALIKIPVRYAVLVVGIIFRFVPLLLDELSGIIKTQIIRGSFGNAKGLKKLKVLASVIVPLILETFRKAQFLSDALTARYFK